MTAMGCIVSTITGQRRPFTFLSRPRLSWPFDPSLSVPICVGWGNTFLVDACWRIGHCSMESTCCPLHQFGHFGPDQSRQEKYILSHESGSNRILWTQRPITERSDTSFLAASLATLM